MRLRLFRDTTRVAIVRFARDRIDNGANQREGWFRVKDVDPWRRRIGNDEHIGRVNSLPAADARAVEPQTIRKNIFVILAKGCGEMLPGSRQIGEFEIHEL